MASATHGRRYFSNKLNISNFLASEERKNFVFVEELIEALNSIQNPVSRKITQLFISDEFSDKTVLEYDIPELGGSVKYEGYLTKQGSFVKTWKKRWFKLYDDKLYVPALHFVLSPPHASLSLPRTLSL